MKTITRSAILVVMLAVAVAGAAAVFRALTNDTPGSEAAAPAPVLAHAPLDSNDPTEQIVESFERLGFSCFQQRDYSYAAPDPSWTLPLQKLAQDAGGPGHWIDAVHHLGWVGTKADALQHLDASVIAGDTSQSYVQTTDQGMPVALNLKEVVLPNGWSIWYAVEVVRAVACPVASG